LSRGLPATVSTWPAAQTGLRPEPHATSWEETDDEPLEQALWRGSVLLTVLLSACGGAENADGPARPSSAGSTSAPVAASETNPLRNAYFGDLHVHTNYSYDAFLNGTRNTPDDAYRYAQGEALPHPAGFEIQLDRPLDFYAVTDHASFLGMMRAAQDPDQAASRHPDAETVDRIMSGAVAGPERAEAYASVRAHTLGLSEGWLDDTVGLAGRDRRPTTRRQPLHQRPGRALRFIRSGRRLG